MKIETNTKYDISDILYHVEECEGLYRIFKCRVLDIVLIIPKEGSKSFTLYKVVNLENNFRIKVKEEDLYTEASMYKKLENVFSDIN